MAVTAAEVRDLRERSGAGMMDCKRALEETGGDLEKAMTLLRERGILKGAKRAERVAADGTVGVYVHHDKKMAVLVEVNSETDFVAKTDEFQELARNLAMQIGARSPLYIQREDVPEEVVEHERRIHRAQAEQEGKPAQAIDKIVEGRIGKWFEEICLLEQPFIRDESRKVKDLIDDVVARLGEKVVVRRFTRYRVGESTD
ncbi:MAG TPA: translation elongation factor Ts [Armatimonadetes bacterium]|mgnify:FL=1|jgi:elongation factor Ts|nr:translation elongation factor Ts [Armatimonadota bacterium]